MKALIIVDPQNSFCPNGELAVNDGDKIMKIINKFSSNFDTIVVTKEKHSKNHKSFITQYDGKNILDVVKIINLENKEIELTLWPEHCVDGTFGEKFHKDLELSNIDSKTNVFVKGENIYEHPFSGFAGKNSNGESLEDYLKSMDIMETYICGVATDYCVKDTVIDSVIAGFKTYLIKDASKGIADNLEPTYEELKLKGAQIILSSEI